MKEKYTRKLLCLLHVSILVLFIIVPFNISLGQNIIFDDFTYSGVDDPAIAQFNRWTIVEGINGPPSGARYKKSNIAFTTDPDDPFNTFMELTSSNRNTIESTSHARLESIDMEYGPGTYAARVFFDNSPVEYQDPIIQTFYTISSHTNATIPSMYAEVDFEYLPWDAWSGDYGGGYDHGMFMTTWETSEIRDHILKKQDFGGWHDLLFSFIDGTNVKWYIDGVFMGQLATKDGSSIYPDYLQYVSFANWVYTLDKAVLGGSPDLRSSTMKVDWFVHIMEAEKTPSEVAEIVENFKGNGILRKNAKGEEYSIITGFNDIKNNSELNDIQIYPNPVRLNFNFKGQDDLKKYSVKIFDAQGKQVLKTQLNNTTLDVSSLKSGIYAIIINNGDSEVIRRFIKITSG